MKKFKYKLNALLKLRRFTEEKVKIEIGKIVQEISSIKNEISVMHGDIAESYTAQEDLAQDLSSSRTLQFFPFFIQGRKEKIKAKENILFSLEKRYQEKLKSLAIARGEVKVLEKLKTKKHDEYKRYVDKKMYADVEENFQMRKHFLEKLGEEI